MRQLTLVAFYGAKPPEFSDYIRSCQHMAAAALGDRFRPYDLRQVHATIIGLEHHEDSPGENACFRRLRGRRAAMDTRGFLDSLRAVPELPLEVQVGGYGKDDRPFLSRNATPYQRSFSIQGENAVVIGWPHRTGPVVGRANCPVTLDLLRRSAQGFGILHAYHAEETDRDNDLFFRIGLIEPGVVSTAAVQGLEQEIRRHMSRRPPLILRIGLDDLKIAVYEDERLPIGATEILGLSAPQLETRLEAVRFFPGPRGP